MANTIASVSLRPDLAEWAKAEGIKISTVLNNTLQEMKFEKENREEENNTKEVLETEALEERRRANALQQEKDTIEMVEKQPEFAHELLKELRKDPSKIKDIVNNYAFWDSFIARYRTLGIKVGLHHLERYARLKGIV